MSTGTRVRRTVTCECCGETGPHRAHGWREDCYNRWIRAGQPPDGPPPKWAGPDAWSAARAAATLAAQERLARYAELRRAGLSRQQAAWELRVHYKTALRYEARLRAGPP